MKLVAFTIVLDGMPWITKHLPVLQATNLDWHWIIVHGAAMNDGSTRWCRTQEPRLSNDGTGEYLHSLKNEIHWIGDNWSIDVIEHPQWKSKDEMVNCAVSKVREPCVLMEIDADEIWKPWQLEKITKTIDQDKIDAMQFRCRYFVGENLVTEGHDCYGDMGYEWWRAWRFEPGMKFQSHEPPDMIPRPKTGWTKGTTSDMGLIFDHFAYATEGQVKFKEQWYGHNGEYDGLLDGWRRLQEVQEFPVKLSDYFPQVKGDLPLVVRADGMG